MVFRIRRSVPMGGPQVVHSPLLSPPSLWASFLPFVLLFHFLRKCFAFSFPSPFSLSFPSPLLLAVRVVFCDRSLIDPRRLFRVCLALLLCELRLRAPWLGGAVFWPHKVSLISLAFPWRTLASYGAELPPRKDTGAVRENVFL